MTPPAYGHQTIELLPLSLFLHLSRNASHRAGQDLVSPVHITLILTTWLDLSSRAPTSVSKVSTSWFG